jgi:mannan polymerase II complex MNN10 subunit
VLHSRTSPNSFIVASPNSFSASAGNRRRRSSAARQLPNLNFNDGAASHSRGGTTSGILGGTSGHILPVIPGTPSAEFDMSRSPSPRPGGWSSPGLNTPYDTGGRSSPFGNGGPQNVTWASAQAKSAEVKGYPGFAPRNQGFLGKHFRKISTSLPFSYGDKEKLGRGRSQGNNKVMQIVNRIAWGLWRLRRILGPILLIILTWTLFYVTRRLMASSCSSHANKYQHCTACTDGLHGLVVVTNSFSSSLQTKVEVLWNGKGPENGQSRGTALRTRRSIRGSGAMIWKSLI